MHYIETVSWKRNHEISIDGWHSYLEFGWVLMQNFSPVLFASLLFNILSRLVITFLPRSKCLLISWLQSTSVVILELKKNKVWHCFHCFPIYFPWSDGTKCHDLRFSECWNLGQLFHFPFPPSSRGSFRIQNWAHPFFSLKILLN